MTTYLDVSPMMLALRTTPDEFEVNDGWLRHTPSRHEFSFAADGRVQIRAACNCALLAVRAGQDRELYECFEEWRTGYWRPLQINREFASHFRPRSAFRQALIDLTATLHRWLLRDYAPRTPEPVLASAK